MQRACKERGDLSSQRGHLIATKCYLKLCLVETLSWRIKCTHAQFIKKYFGTISPRSLYRQLKKIRYLQEQLHYMQRISDILFWTYNFRTLLHLVSDIFRTLNPYTWLKSKFTPTKHEIRLNQHP